MPVSLKNITVIGDGGWGTTLAVHLARKGYTVSLWGAFPANLEAIRKDRENKKFLPGIRIPAAVHPVADLSTAVEKADLVVMAVPSKFVKKVVRDLQGLSFSRKWLLSVTKGIDTRSLERMSQILSQACHPGHLAVLSGPNIAREVATGIPSTSVIASRDIRTAKRLQKIFNTERFRVYTNTDVIGLELCGSLKNIIAIACGICDGLGFGANTKAAILTRGLVEMARLGQALGAKKETFAGLAGLGDLVTTCISPQSRNRSVGEQLGKGKSIRSILNSMDMIAEGVETVKAAHKLSLMHKVDMPITREIYRIITHGKNPHLAMENLMKRRLRSE